MVHIPKFMYEDFQGWMVSGRGLATAEEQEMTRKPGLYRGVIGGCRIAVLHQGFKALSFGGWLLGPAQAQCLIELSSGMA